MTSYTLCGNPKGGCCPTVTISNTKDIVIITDDDGDSIIMTKDQYRIMCRKGCC